MTAKRDQIAGVLSDALLMDAPLGGVMGVVEMLQSLASAHSDLARAVKDPRSLPYKSIDGQVGDLVEGAIMCGRGLNNIARSIDSLAYSMERVAEAIASAKERP